MAKLKRTQKSKKAATSSENKNTQKKASKRPECQLCNKTFSKSVHLTRHINNIHAGIDNTSFDFDPEKSPEKPPIEPPMPRSFDCNMCGKRFSFPAFLKRHHDDVHSIDGHIEILNKLNPNNSIVTELEKTPSGFVDPLFSVPDFEFIKAQPIPEPVNIHKPTQSYDCSICPSKFKRSYHLTRHLNNVHGNNKRKAKKHSKAVAAENSQPEKEVEPVDVKMEVEVPPMLEEMPNKEPMETNETRTDINEVDPDCAAEALNPELEDVDGAEASNPELDEEDVGEAELAALIPEIQMDTSDPQVDP